jgi:hypothetical protein
MATLKQPNKAIKHEKRAGNIILFEKYLSMKFRVRLTPEIDENVEGNFC